MTTTVQPDDDGVRRVPCPTCGRPARFDAGNRWRPFCTERCRGIDLGAWASGSYRLPAESPEGDPGETTPPPRGHDDR